MLDAVGSGSWDGDTVPDTSGKAGVANSAAPVFEIPFMNWWAAAVADFTPPIVFVVGRGRYSPVSGPKVGSVGKPLSGPLSTVSAACGPKSPPPPPPCMSLQPNPAPGLHVMAFVGPKQEGMEIPRGLPDSKAPRIWLASRKFGPMAAHRLSISLIKARF